MMQKSFNLITDPWVKVIDEQNNEQVISLEQLFKKPTHYLQLAGEMKSQDLAIMRLILAILTTVYSRFDAHNVPYEWIKINPESFQPISIDEDDFFEESEDDFLTTWRDIYRSGAFSKILFDYLGKYKAHFDLLSDQYPFFQVTEAQYDSFVPTNKKVATGKGTVAVKQVNRTLSESNNSPDIFSPKAPLQKNKITLDELTRWLITYQNYTAVTDKTKIVTKDKFSVSSGWLYGLNPVFAVGNNLFETLMLNLILTPESEDNPITQKPVWEYSYEQYIQERSDALLPDNIAELYTLWSRIIHIEWQDEQPIIFSAGLPKVESQNAFIEPMTTWQLSKKDKVYRPAMRRLDSLGKAMWRSFGQYVKTSGNDDNRKPKIVNWIQLLKRGKLVDNMVHLATVGLISDGNATSQSPAAEFEDDMRIEADVLFDEDLDSRSYWPKRIEDTITLTDRVGVLYNHFAANIGKLRGFGNPGEFANKKSSHFYEQLNESFYLWLAGLTNHDERDEKVNEWKKQLLMIAKASARQLLSEASPQDLRIRSVKGETGERNIFIYYRIFNGSLAKILDLKKEEFSK